MYPFNWQHVYVPILPPNLENFLDAPVPYIMGLLRRTHDIELSKKGSVCIVDIDNGELDLPEELPEFPYERELVEELRNNIIKFGGKEGADLLKEHAIESRDILESSTSNRNDLSGISMDSSYSPFYSEPSNSTGNSDTMEQLNKMISKFESLSANSRPIGSDVAGSEDGLRLNNAIREVFVNRFAHMFCSYEHFVIAPEQEIVDDLSLTPQQHETQQNFDKTSFLSDQKQSHLPFLSRFLETQTFSTFVDEYIVEIEETGRLREDAFSVRLNALKGKKAGKIFHFYALEYLSEYF